MGDQHDRPDERVRALRRRAMLAERLLLDLGAVTDRDAAAGLLVQALTTVGGCERAELRVWPDDPPVPLRPGLEVPDVVLARSVSPWIDPDTDDGERSHRHHAIDRRHGLELVVDGSATPPVAVDRALAAMGAALDRIAANQDLLHEARTDPLTGLMNRRAIDERIEGELARIERLGGPVSVLLADLDGFKHVNDTLGHAAGDELLRGVARVITRVARAADDTARLGGDEFLLLLPATGRLGAHVVARRLGEEIARLGSGVSASIGVATVEDRPVPTVAELLLWADAAMYAAKNDPGRRVVHAGPPGAATPAAPTPVSR